MPTLPNMGLITPTQGGDSGTWDDKINACFAQVDAHDHTSGKGVAVPVAGLNINADLPLGGFGITNLGKISFSAIAAPSSGSKNLFVNSNDNELYWRTNAGTNVKLTNGASINTTLVGGIVGDYSSVGAEVAYDDANDRYTFKQQGAKPWARLASGPVRIFEFNTTESVYVEHAVAAALGASYTVTWPTGPDPAGEGVAHFLQISTAGAISPNNTIAATLTANGYNFTSNRVKVLAAPAFQRSGSSHTFNGTYWALGNSSTDILYASIPLNTGDRIKSVKVFLDKNSDNTNTVTVELFRIDPASSGSISTSLGTGTDAGNATGLNASGIGPTGLTETVGAGHAYVVAVSQNDATPSSADFIFTIEVTYDHPV